MPGGLAASNAPSIGTYIPVAIPQIRENLPASFEGRAMRLQLGGTNSRGRRLWVLVRRFRGWQRLAAGAPDDDRNAEHDERPKEPKHSESPEAGLRAAR
jgi:hypothetical protein